MAAKIENAGDDLAGAVRAPWPAALCFLLVWPTDGARPRPPSHCEAVVQPEAGQKLEAEAGARTSCCSYIVVVLADWASLPPAPAWTS